MKIIVIGGSGLIGSKLVKNLRKGGHEAVVASPSNCVNTVTGEGLAGALKGAQVVIDDVLATGGTAAAACALVERLGADVVEVACLIELSGLEGRKRISYPVFSLLSVELD